MQTGGYEGYTLRKFDYVDVREITGRYEMSLEDCQAYVQGHIQVDVTIPFSAEVVGKVGVVRKVAEVIEYLRPDLICFQYVVVGGALLVIAHRNGSFARQLLQRCTYE